MASTGTPYLMMQLTSIPVSFILLLMANAVLAMPHIDNGANLALNPLARRMSNMKLIAIEDEKGNKFMKRITCTGSCHSSDCVSVVCTRPAWH